jgi:hypothetical protein
MSPACTFLAIAAAVAALPLSSSGALETGTIVGQVLDYSDRPCRFANVVVLGTGLGAAAREDGKFTIRLLPEGLYQVRASLVEHDTAFLNNVRVSANDTTKLEIRLRAFPVMIYMWGPCGFSREYRADIESPELPGDSRSRIRMALGLIPPVDIESWEKYKDGGSIGMTLRDSCGTALSISWDGAMRVVRPNGAGAVGESHAEPRLLYLGAPFSTKGARPIAVGSPRETALLDVFRLWTDERLHIPVAQQDSLRKIAHDYTMPEEDRQRKLSGLDAQARQALEVAALLRFLESQRTELLGGQDRGDR